MAIIGFIVFGFVVGALARLVKPGKQNLSILATGGLGMVGSVIGGILANAIGKGHITELNFWGTVFAVIAAVLLVGVAETVTGKPRSN